MKLTIAQAIAVLKVPGTYFSGSDWKYGYPHKFYLCHGDKVYTEDLKRSSDAELSEFGALSLKFFGIKFYRNDEGNLMYRCDFPDPHGYGYQRAGHVGPDGEPVRLDNWNFDFPGKLVN